MNNDVAVPRNLTGSPEAFKVYEIRGIGRPLRIGQEIVFETPEGTVCGKVIDSKRSKAWWVLIEAKRRLMTHYG